MCFVLHVCVWPKKSKKGTEMTCSNTQLAVLSFDFYTAVTFSYVQFGSFVQTSITRDNL